MTKKTEVKAKTKAYNAEEKVLDKIKKGTAKAESEKKSNPKVVTGGKRTFAQKDGDNKDSKSGDNKGQPIMNRRQKQKVSDLIKKLRISYNKLLMKKKEMSGEEKHAVVQECINDINEKYEALCYKHDGCRVLQTLIKFGNRPQRILVIDKLKAYFSHLMQQKYSHYLASKMYHYAPDDAAKDSFRKLIGAQMNKLVLHSFAAEVIEYMYTESQSDADRRQMILNI